MESRDKLRWKTWRSLWVALLVALGPLVVGSIVLATMYSSASRKTETSGASIQSAGSRLQGAESQGGVP